MLKFTIAKNCNNAHKLYSYKDLGINIFQQSRLHLDNAVFIILSYVTSTLNRATLLLLSSPL